MSGYNWSNEDVFKLIDLFQERELLWNTTLDDYKDRSKKHDAWIEIANVFNLDKQTIERKMRSLIGQFQRECRKPKSGTGSDDSKKWFAFKKLMFLKDRNKPDLTYDGGSEDSQNSEREKEVKDYVPEPKKSKLQELLQAQTKSFGEYIGQQLEHVETFQRHVAEKLISEVLFLARTGHLDFSSRIDSSNAYSRPSISIPNYPSSSSFVQSSSSPRNTLPAARFVASSSYAPSNAVQSTSKQPPQSSKTLNDPLSKAVEKSVPSSTRSHLEIKDEPTELTSSPSSSSS